MKLFYATLILFLLVGCDKEQEVPEGIIPPSRMTGILIDIYVSEAKVSAVRVSRDSAASLFKVFEQKIFEKHGVDSVTYQKSYEYYLNNLEKMEEVYGAVIDSLSLKERLEDEK